LQDGCSGFSQCEVGLKRRRNIDGCISQAGRQGRAVFDGLRRALRHEGQHGMTRVSQKRHAPQCPFRQRIAFEQRPLERLIDYRSQPRLASDMRISNCELALLEAPEVSGRMSPVALRRPRAPDVAPGSRRLMPAYFKRHQTLYSTKGCFDYRFGLRTRYVSIGIGRGSDRFA
jgi:hypothetical protein